MAFRGGAFRKRGRPVTVRFVPGDQRRGGEQIAQRGSAITRIADMLLGKGGGCL